MSATLDDYLTRSNEVEGWFPEGDRIAFSVFGRLQADNAIRGHLMEIGAFFGKSAIALGYMKRPDETLVVCDLFEDPAEDALNQRENTVSYHSRSLTRAGFEENYLRFHPALPQIEQRPSNELDPATLPTPMRFVHIDGSHVYEHVWADLLLSREVLGDNGIVVIDDYRTAHTPGVAAATWRAVINEGFRPLCVTNQKMYGTWTRWDSELVGQLRERWKDVGEMTAKDATVGDLEFLRLVPSRPKKRRRA
jgi:Methyltransferase domain